MARRRQTSALRLPFDLLFGALGLLVRTIVATLKLVFVALRSLLGALHRTWSALGRSNPRLQRGLGVLTLIAVIVTGYLWIPETRPTRPQNLCSIFVEKPAWHAAARRSAREHGVSEAIMMSILAAESSFTERARPPRRRLFGFLPWRRLSSAYGYAQVLDGTWADYQRARGGANASRTDFGDAIDFVGWYAGVIHRQTGIAKNNPEHLYLAYHEGPGGYQRGTYHAKPAIRAVAVRVARRAETYAGQYAGCEDSLVWRQWVRRGLLGLGGLGALTLLWLLRRWLRA